METYTYKAPEANTDLFFEEPPMYGSFWERFVAAFIDGLILIIPNSILQISLGPLGILVSLILPWLYSAFMESSSSQATFGKKAMGLKVTTADGQPITFGQATGRHFGKIISSIILFIGYLMMLWDNNKQTLHDKMVGSLVVKK
jgi:uncharacterized RDD family membrane protein YckC